MNYTEIYRKVADLSEATLSPEHAADIAAWIVAERPTARGRIQRLLWGRSRDETLSLAHREALERHNHECDWCPTHDGEGSAP